MNKYEKSNSHSKLRSKILLVYILPPTPNISRPNPNGILHKISPLGTYYQRVPTLLETETEKEV